MCRHLYALIIGTILGGALWNVVGAAECPTDNKKEFKSGPYHFYYESLTADGSDHDKYVFVRCVENKTRTSLFIDWKKTKLSGYVPGEDISKSEVEFTPRQKAQESSELWYGSRPSSLDVALIRHKQEQSSLLRFPLRPAAVFAQLRPTSLQDLPLMKAIERKWPQPATKDVLRSYVTIGVPLAAGWVSNRVVEESRLLRLTLASLSRIVGTPDGYRYEYLFSYQYLPSLASSSLPRSAAVHAVQPSSETIIKAFQAADVSGRLINVTGSPVLPDRVPALVNRGSPRPMLRQMDIIDDRNNVVATIPVAVWEPATPQ